MAIAGVYAIWLVGSPYVWVGQSADIPRRLRVHRDAWVWPNEAEYAVLWEDKPKSGKRNRLRSERVWARRFREQGCLLLSDPDNVSLLRLAAYKRSGQLLAKRTQADSRIKEWTAKMHHNSQSPEAKARRSAILRETWRKRRIAQYEALHG